MFANLKAAARFAPDRPITQLIHENQDCRVIVFGFEPGQAVPLHTSSSSVLMQVIEGQGRFTVGDEERPVGPNDLAFCPPNVPHALAAGADNRLIVVAVIAPRP